MTKEKKYTDLIPVIVERTKATLPEGFDSWGIKSILPDLTTRNGYQWPFPGGIAECDPKEIDADSASACPRYEGDGLCVATSWRGMASGGFPARMLLLVAYGADEVLGRDDAEGKLRCPRVAVVALADGERLLREAGSGADLSGANLRGADLSGANLRGADLSWANLRGADLSWADLSGANLSGANLRGADLSLADLRLADLRGADLSLADLRLADLRGADLSLADLSLADLSLADLRGAENASLPAGWKIDEAGLAVKE